MGYSIWGPSQNSLMPQKTNMFSLSLNPLPAPQEAKQGAHLHHGSSVALYSRHIAVDLGFVFTNFQLTLTSASKDVMS
jgi:hypothetical protein